MIHTRKNSLTPKKILSTIKYCFKFHYAGLATWSIYAVIFFLSILAGLRFETNSPLFIAGEVATEDVIASRSLRIEDPHATLIKREQTSALQPHIYDIDKKSINVFHERTINLLKDISSIPLEIANLNSFQATYNSDNKTAFGSEFFFSLSSPKVQGYITSTLLPFAELLLSEGVFSNNQTTSSTAPILIRDAESGRETLLTPNASTQNVSSFQLQIGQQLGNANLTPIEKKAVLQLIEYFAPVTLTLNQEATAKRTASVVSAIPSVYYYIEKGELIVSEGEIVTREGQLKMQALHRISSGIIDIQKSLGTFILAVIMSCALFISPSAQPGSLLYPRVQSFFAVLLLVFSLIAMFAGYYLKTLDPNIANILAYAYPLSGATSLTALVFAARRYYSVGILLSFFCTIFLCESLALFIFFFISSIVHTLITLKAQTRQDFFYNTITLFLVQVILALGCGLFNIFEMEQFPLLLVAITTNIVLSLLLFFALSPFIEVVFGLTTRFRLMELMNFDQPLLQELMVTTPGSYNHSIIVAHLVEAGANAVKANVLLAKVAALYHDIGKLSHPNYFVENQGGGPNKHDTIAPALSALILVSHVKHGVELAQKHRLGKEITDIIAQHHGNRCIHYFYNKAVQAQTGEGEAPNEQSFCYPYPKPQTKEAALVMLADAIEASSRTLSDPTPARIESHVKQIVHGIYTDGQLDETEMTFRDLHNVSAAFTRIMTGLFHQRVVYPSKKTENKKTIFDTAEK